MSPTPNFTECLAQTVAAVKTAAEGLDPERDSQIVADLARDVKIAADARLHASLVAALQAIRPVGVLSEEGLVPSPHLQEPDQWIVDPLDGSLNYSRGIPLCCISVAYWEGSIPRFGVVYDFHRAELFSGIVGSGAWLNGRPIGPRRAASRQDAVLCTGFPTSSDFGEESVSAFVRAIREFKKVRLLGSAALSLAYVAAGRVDAYRERDIAIWDVAAGVAIVQAAGGRTQMVPSRIENRLHVEAGKV